MFLPESRKSDSNSAGSSSSSINLWTDKIDQRLWRAIDFLHLFVMFFSIFTSIVLGALRNELSEQCPLYAKIMLRPNVTVFSSDIVDQQSTWGSAYTCEFALFAYLSAFVLSFVSLWVHVVFRQVLRTERLLRLPIGLTTLSFAIVTIVATTILTIGVISLCNQSDVDICSTSGTTAFRQSRWKIFALPAGGWLTTVTLCLNTIARIIQLLSKPRKSPETLKTLINQLLVQKQRSKSEQHFEYDAIQSPYVSSDSQFSSHSSMNYYPHSTLDERPPVSYYPVVPQYRQIKRPSRCRRFCCPCFPQRSPKETYRPFVLPEEYFQRTTLPQSSSSTANNICEHHQKHSSVERAAQTDSQLSTTDNDQNKEQSTFPGRRRSSVRFEDEILFAQQSDVPSIKDDQTHQSLEPSDQSDSDLKRNVSFRNNEDDLWTTVTIKAEPSSSIQSSHFNRLIVENLSSVDTFSPSTEKSVTAIQITNKPIEQIIDESTTFSDETLPPPPPSMIVTSHVRRTRTKLNRLPTVPSRSHTSTSDDGLDFDRVKPVEEIQAIVTDKYNYNDLSAALKSNVARLKKSFSSSTDSNPSDNGGRQNRRINSMHHSSDC